MRLYGAIQKVEPQDDGTVRVYGIATSEAVDEQGEIVRADAIRAAIPDYMRFPALREMHQLSAAGTTLEAEVCEDGTTRIVAHVVDPVAVTKVKNQVYRGFSIGGRVTQREPGNPKTITGLVLNEISLVDRPANPEAVFDCWKAAMMQYASPAFTEHPAADHAPENSMSAALEHEPFNAPIQVWACSVSDHRHLAKADALKCLQGNTSPVEDKRAGLVTRAVTANNAEPVSGAEFSNHSTVPSDDHHVARHADPGYQSDGKKRCPLDTELDIRAAWSRINRSDIAKRYSEDELRRVRDEIISAWREKIGTQGPSTAKASRASASAEPCDASRIAGLITDLDWLRDALESEAATGNDQPPLPARLQEIINELSNILSSSAIDEAGDTSGEPETGKSLLGSEIPAVFDTVIAASGFERDAARLQKNHRTIPQQTGASITKAKHSRADQVLLDAAHFACDQCLKIGGMSVDEQANINRARFRLQEAGARRMLLWTPQEPDDGTPSSAWLEGSEGDGAEADIGKMLGLVTEALCKREQAHQRLMDIAHECLKALTDGAACEAAAKFGSRHSKETLEHFNASHLHLVAAGASCEPMGSDEVHRPRFGKAARAADVVNRFPDERGETVALAKVLGEVVPMLERLSRRVEEIARTPLPPLTIAKGTVSISKQQDRESAIAGGNPELSPDAIAAALAKMSKEEQTLALIKASHATPIRIPGSTAE